MTDEGSTPPAPESAPEASPPPLPAPEPAAPPPLPAAPEPVPEPPAAISQEAITEISQEISEAVQDAVTAAVKPESEAPPIAQPAPQSIAPTPIASSPKPSHRGHMLAVVKSRKAERLERIVLLAREKRIIVNDDVEKLLRVSNATATRYLNELVKQGSLKRFGPQRHAKYEVA